MKSITLILAILTCSHLIASDNQMHNYRSSFSYSIHDGSHNLNLDLDQLELSNIDKEEDMVIDCTVSFSGELSVKVVTIKYECSSTQADCTKATNDAFNCLTAVYSKVRSLVAQSLSF